MPYEPGALPETDPNASTHEAMDDLKTFIERELLSVSRAFSESTAVDLRTVHAAPEKPRAGMVVYADGTDWNPGSGEGLYAYNESGSWVFLGVQSTGTEVTAASTFGTDNRVLRSDGTGRGAQASAVTIDDSGNATGFGTITGTTITASTGFSGPLTGAVTGAVTGDVTGNVTGNLTGSVTGSASGNAKIKTGTYTGDGSTSKAITGVGFQPKFLMIFRAVTSGSNSQVYTTSDTIVDNDASGLAFQAATAATNAQMINDRIKSLDSDGFTVSDGGSDFDPNTNTQSYEYVAFG